MSVCFKNGDTIVRYALFAQLSVVLLSRLGMCADGMDHLVAGLVKKLGGEDMVQKNTQVTGIRQYKDGVVLE